MDSALKNDTITSDPFAEDIFAGERQEFIPDLGTTQLPEQEKLPVWNHRIPKITRPNTPDWTKLLTLLPFDFSTRLPKELADSFSDILNVKNSANTQIFYLSQKEINTPKQAPPVNHDSYWITAGINETAAEIFFEIENVFAVQTVDAILTGEIPNKPNIRELTPSEAAVFEFALMNLCFDANKTLSSTVFKFRDAARKMPKTLKSRLETENPSILIANWQVSFDSQSAVVKMYFTREVFESLIPQENALLWTDGRRLAAIDYYKDIVKDIPVRLGFGESEMTFAELAAIEPDDVVLLENHSFFVQNRTLRGKGDLFLGNATNLKLFGEIISNITDAEDFSLPSYGNGSQTVIRRFNPKHILQFLVSDFPEPENLDLIYNNMDAENTTEPDEPVADLPEDEEETGEGLQVEKLGVTLRVELETMHITLQEAASLRANQLIELGVRPTDPVNILIDNKIVGRGELVEVEGRLGVRVMNLLK